MPQRIDVPGHGIVEFPDGMSDADIVKAIKANSAPQQTRPTAEPPSIIEKLAMGAADPIHGGAQLLTHALPGSVVDAGNKLNNWLADKTGLVAKVPERGLNSLVTGQPTGVDALVAKREVDYQAKRAAAGESGFDGMRTLGNFASGLAIPTAGATTALGRVAAGAVNGAVGGGLTPVGSGNYWEQKSGQLAGGAAFGGAIPAVLGGVSRVISPKASTNPDLQLLRDEGVHPTIGQALGGRWNALEEKAQSLPILGDFISNARKGSIEQFNNAAINRASGKVGAKIEGSGQDAVARAGDSLAAAYDQAKQAIGHFQLDSQAAQELGTLRQMAQRLQPSEQKAFNDAWSKFASEVSPNGALTADSFKRLDSHLGVEVGRFSKSSDAYQQQAGDALKELQRIINDNAMRANPNAANLKAAADSGWANLVRVEGASKAAKNSGGVFTPAQLNSAIQQADRSVRGRAVARGSALMQDLSNAGQNVIGNKIPNSFTTDRALIAGGGLGAAAINPAIPLGLLGSGMLYTAPSQRALVGLLASRPEGAQAVADSLRKASPRLGLLAGQVVGQDLLR